MSRKAVEQKKSQIEGDQPATVVNIFRIGLVCGVLAMYTPHSLSTEMGDGDSPELLASACTNSLPHPPGYPLYTLLLQLWLSIGLNPHLLSTCLGVLASTAVFDAVLLLSSTLSSGKASLIIAIVASVHYSLATLRLHTVVEVFALNSALLSWTFYFGIRWLLRRPNRCPWHCGLLMGVASSNQHTSLLLLPSFIYVALRRLPLRGMFSLGICFVVGLSPYMYLPFFQGELSWPTSSLLRHILRGDYGTLSLGSATNSHATHNGSTSLAVIAAFIRDTGALSLCLGLVTVGAALPMKNSKVRVIAMVSVTSFLIYMTVFSWMANLSLQSSLLRHSVYPRFWAQPLLPLHLLVGLGLATLWSTGRKLYKGAALCLIIVWGLEGIVRYSSTELVHSRVISDYYSEFLRKLPRNSILVTTGDMSAYAMKYLLGCTTERIDIRTVSEAELSSGDWWISSQRKHIMPGLSEYPAWSARPRGLDLGNTHIPNATEHLKILMKSALQEDRPLFFVHLPSFMTAGNAPDYFGPDKLIKGLAFYPTGPAIRVY